MAELHLSFLLTQLSALQGIVEGLCLLLRRHRWRWRQRDRCKRGLHWWRILRAWCLRAWCWKGLLHRRSRWASKLVLEDLKAGQHGLLRWLLLQALHELKKHLHRIHRRRRHGRRLCRRRGVSSPKRSIRSSEWDHWRHRAHARISQGRF